MSLDYALDVTSVSHSFNGTAVLRGVSFKVRAGTAMAVLGRSGCGKTTLLRIIAGLIHAQAGSVRISGRDVSTIPTRDRNLGFVFQNLALFPHLTVRKNIEFPFRHGGKVTDDLPGVVSEILRRTRLLAAADQRIDELSGGMQQRVAIARALVYRPAVILLDEPLTSLDNPLKRELLDLLVELKASGEHTFLYVTHDDREVRHIADDLVVLDDGLVARSGSLIDVLADPGPAAVSQLLKAEYGQGGVT